MTRLFPVIQFGNDVYNIDVAQGFLTKVGRGINQGMKTPLSDLPLLQPENKFLIFYKEGEGIIGPDKLAKGLPVGTRLYRFDGPEKVDPVGYAIANGRPLPTEPTPSFIRAERIRLPAVYYAKTETPAKTMREFYSKMMRWKWSSSPVENKVWNSRKM